ncbi:MAG: hypothetical protein V5A45_05375 [Haloarculaceae archaeon]
MPLCDRCDDEIPISATDVSELADDQNITKELLRKIHQPSDEPFTIIEGTFAVWNEEFDIEQRGAFPLLLCRDCTSEFVDWVQNPDVTPTEQETHDHSITWSYTEN